MSKRERDQLRLVALSKQNSGFQGCLCVDASDKVGRVNGADRP